jgi:NAD(P)-dependent dehydrogenase (short-subunit alcohol dehydrogenase family)
MDLHLTGRRALVTGGSRGIGLAIARALAAEGVDVAVAGRDLERAQAAAEALAAGSGRRTVGLRVEMSDTAAVRAMVAAATEAIGGVDILVNNAAMPGGQSTPPSLASLTEDAFHADVDVKVMGYLRAAQAVAPQMIDRGWGRIINISGLAARQTGSIVGSVRNVAVAALTANLADELGPHGINVTVVHPGVTRTEKTPGVLARRAEATGTSEEEAEAAMAAGTSIGRMIDASEVADVVAFLASPRSAAITGDAIAVGGGGRGTIHY